jgi:U1 small nuclear ribonucleoprotein
MTQFLPPNLLALFAPREPIKFVPPLERPKHHRRLPYTGLAQYMQLFETDLPPLPVKTETKEEKKERKKRERLEQVQYKIEQELALWDPQNNDKSTEDPYKSLFVGRLSYETSESKLRREFESFGPVRKVRIISDAKTGKPRGYAFIEFEHERDMHDAYRRADQKKIDGRPVLVDVERGRTVKGWKPRRLGGGLGGRLEKKKVEPYAMPPPIAAPSPAAPPAASSYRSSRYDEPPPLPPPPPVDRDRRDRDRERRSRSKDRDRRKRSRSRDKEKEKERPREGRDRSERSASERGERDRSERSERDKSGRRSRSRDRSERGGEKDKHRDKERDKDRERSDKPEREKDVGREKDREKDVGREKDRERNRDRDKERRHGDKERSDKQRSGRERSDANGGSGAPPQSVPDARPGEPGELS